MTDDRGSEGRRILVCAPFGRDAEGLLSLLKERNYDVQICPDVQVVAALVGNDTGAVLVTEEALAKGVDSLRSALESQPP